MAYGGLHALLEEMGSGPGVVKTRNGSGRARNRWVLVFKSQAAEGEVESERLLQVFHETALVFHVGALQRGLTT